MGKCDQVKTTHIYLICCEIITHKKQAGRQFKETFQAKSFIRSLVEG